MIDLFFPYESHGHLFRSIDLYNPIYIYLYLLVDLGPDAMVLKNVSFEARPNQVVALVGQSGSGKTSCVSLLQRLYDCQQGVVRIDGLDVKDLKFSFLRRNMAVVSQEPILFAISARENIAFGVEECEEQKLQEAARLANCALAGSLGRVPRGAWRFSCLLDPFEAFSAVSSRFKGVSGWREAVESEVIALSPSGRKAMTPWWANEAFSFPEAGAKPQFKLDFSFFKRPEAARGHCAGDPGESHDPPLGRGAFRLRRVCF